MKKNLLAQAYEQHRLSRLRGMLDDEPVDNLTRKTLRLLDDDDLREALYEECDDDGYPNEATVGWVLARLDRERDEEWK